MKHALKGTGLIVAVMLSVSCNEIDDLLNHKSPANDPNVVNGVDTTVIRTDFPYQSKFVTVNGKRIHYVDEGQGEQTFLLVHGIPTSSYLWRNVIPHLQTQGRVIALDLAGWGLSDKLAVEEMSWTSQTAYLEGFVDQLQLDRIIWVMHDLGGPLGLDIARRNESKVAGLVFFDTQIAPIPSLDEVPPGEFRDFFVSISRGTPNNHRAGSGWDLIINQNFFPREQMNNMMRRTLSPAEIEAYAAPFPTPASRRIIWETMRGVPVLGELDRIGQEDPERLAENQANAQSLGASLAWLQTTELPKLAFYADPGLTFPEAIVPLLEGFPNTEVQSAGESIHYYQEDVPHRLGIAMAAWADTTSL